MNSPLTVRPATVTDVPALVELAAVTFPLACPPSTTAEAIAEHLRVKLSAEVIGGWVAREDSTVVVAADGDRLCAYALVVTGPCGDPLAARALATVGVDPDHIHELSKIYALPAQQGSGIAAALLDACVAAAVDAHGEAPVWLGTNSENARAQAFYRRCGFEVVGERTFNVGGRDESDVVMLRA
ncbi:GNAT family N-acetyltransferase [Demequina sp. NBRC 110053]|uniref:GNAT family N-acetyltransferase n=1 Tax=Demequina sp. NBRC 110053 TaxID=1570342 RepID=UPI000A05A4EE|nr:N-acetyltransferase [Demequina sp. NBRC 110053]